MGWTWGLRGVLQDLQPDGAVLVRPVAVQQAHDRDLPLRSTALDDAPLLALVHETCGPADVGLIDFDFAADLAEGRGLHREPDAMEHEPRGFLSDPERPCDFVGADAVLGVGDEP